MEHDDSIPQVVDRNTRRFQWKPLVLAVVILVIIFFSPSLYQFSQELMNELTQAQQPAPATEIQTPVTAQVEPPVQQSFRALLDKAIEYDFKGHRAEAHKFFQQLLEQVPDSPANYDEKAAAILPRAAVFYSSGNELAPEQLKLLLENAYNAVRRVHGDDYYEMEYVLLGLEKFYISQGDYKKAATYVSGLENFYRENYKENKDARNATVIPTMRRRANHYMKAEDYAQARRLLQHMLTMPQFKGKPNTAIHAKLEEIELLEKAQQNTGPAPSLSASMMGGGYEPQQQTTVAAKEVQVNTKQLIKSIQIQGINIDGVIEEDNRFDIQGSAEENKQVAEYLRRLEKEIGGAGLIWLNQEKRDNKKTSVFLISVKKK